MYVVNNGNAAKHSQEDLPVAFRSAGTCLLTKSYTTPAISRQPKSPKEDQMSINLLNLISVPVQRKLRKCPQNISNSVTMELNV